ncbi:hypothetical protein [Burkholderia multivorans]|uniref:hypothetical protein n=1 Tax=Burkholderia multivorans TaxID=87883 RepID=UPI0011B1F227|nr:hypothetical protein [Burkholderia multivorans]MBU9123442.1 hypothetical protein [Burkholderia multivorans]
MKSYDHFRGNAVNAVKEDISGRIDHKLQIELELMIRQLDEGAGHGRIGRQHRPCDEAANDPSIADLGPLSPSVFFREDAAPGVVFARELEVESGREPPVDNYSMHSGPRGLRAVLGQKLREIDRFALGFLQNVERQFLAAESALTSAWRGFQAELSGLFLGVKSITPPQLQGCRTCRYNSLRASAFVAASTT